MREILFRGKRIDNGEWLEGFYCQREEKIYGGTKTRHMILIPCPDSYSGARWIDVDPSTVGQYTGLTDKNGKKIFDGDICTINFLTISGKVNRRENYKCEFYEGKFCFVSDNGKFRCWYSEKEYIYEGACRNNIEVVGNIHDNPELLKGENND